MKSAARSITLVTLMLVASLVPAKAAMMVAPVTQVTFHDAMADALALASMHSDSQVMRISGSSMYPFFGEGALVVVKPIDAAKLRAGMVVVYRNRFGETVAHRLVARGEGGWVAQGYNNSAADSTPVNAANLVGVVYATFNTNGIVSTISQRLEVAYAAPAR